MAHFIKYNGYSPGTSGYGFWLPLNYKIASSATYSNVWRNGIGVWIAHKGVFNPVGGNVADMTQTGYGISSYCGAGIYATQTQYQRYATFQSVLGNTSALEVQWKMDTGAWSASDSFTGLSYSTSVVTASHLFPSPLGPGTGIDDGGDHALHMQFRVQSTAGGGWSSWMSGSLGGPSTFNEAGC